jgi:hypothetical protein
MNIMPQQPPRDVSAITASANEAAKSDFPQSVAVLLEIYKENTSHGRHLETQRHLVSAFVMTIAGAALGGLVTAKFNPATCQVIGVILVAFGILGSFFSVIQYGKWCFNRVQWRMARRRIDELCPTAHLMSELEKDRKLFHVSFWGLISSLPLHWLWTLLNLIVVFMGTYLLFWSHSIFLDALRKELTGG